MYNHQPIEPISSKVNETTVGLMCKLLDSNDYGAISSELRLVPDVKLLLDFVLCVSSFGSTGLDFYSFLLAAR